MYSIVCPDDRNVFALKSSNRCSREYDGAYTCSAAQAIAHLVCKDRAVDYWMCKSRITVGRSSSKRSSADVDMGQSTFISRNHLEIYTTDSRFYALVTGKNGVFVDDVFHKKGGSAFELPNSCLIRFPSTEIKINFEALLPETQHADIKPYVCSDPQPLQNSVALKTNSFGDLYSSSNHGLNILDGSLYPVKEEVVDHVVADPGDVKKAEVASEFSNIAPVLHQEEKELQTCKSVLPQPSSTTTEHTKPPFSYAQLIVQAISSQVDRQLTLSGIYNYITKLYPYYRHGDKGWQNSIRHNLSLNRYFMKVPRAQEEAGKGCFWRIDPNSEGALMSQAFKKRRQRPVPYCKTNSFEALQSSGLNMSDSNTMIGTPDDSCASWEGPQINGEDSETLPSTEQTTPASEQTVRCLSMVNNFNKPSYNTVSVAAVSLFASPNLSKPRFIFAKPLPVSSSTDQLIVSTTAGLISSNNNNMGFQPQDTYMASTGDGLKGANESLESKSKQQPFHIISQPKTIFLRPTTNSLNFSMQPGSQLIRFSYAPQANNVMVSKAVDNRCSRAGGGMEFNGVAKMVTSCADSQTDVSHIGDSSMPHVSGDVAQPV